MRHADTSLDARGDRARLRRSLSSANTRKAYASDWRHYSAWTRRHAFPALPPDPKSWASISPPAPPGRSPENPTWSPPSSGGFGLAMEFRAARRNLRPRRPPRRHRPRRRPPHPGAAAGAEEAILPEDLLAMIATLDLRDLRGLRDRAILLIGFAGGLRARKSSGSTAAPGRPGTNRLDRDPRRRHPRHPARQDRLARGRNRPRLPRAQLPGGRAGGVVEIRTDRTRPLFRRVIGNTVGPERLADKHVARLVKRTALVAGVRGDLTEGQRERTSRPFAARRPRLLRRGRRTLGAEAARPRLGGNDPALPAPPRPVPRQSHQGGGVVARNCVLNHARPRQRRPLKPHLDWAMSDSLLV